ncbi:hypothetical protein L596_019522 [Steinernema carpocapsae]|uniref:Uncharacterized protein n=1 Tax=Steinernema carpocapsae TaxID=34508 RepID=A0A4U5MQR8_STECR|nr:hypothetical protein L596_019522 [Steinernema carpocapsae]
MHFSLFSVIRKICGVKTIRERVNSFQSIEGFKHRLRKVLANISLAAKDKQSISEIQPGYGRVQTSLHPTSCIQLFLLSSTVIGCLWSVDKGPVAFMS